MRLNTIIIVGINSNMYIHLKSICVHLSMEVVVVE